MGLDTAIPAFMLPLHLHVRPHRNRDQTFRPYLLKYTNLPCCFTHHYNNVWILHTANLVPPFSWPMYKYFPQHFVAARFYSKRMLRKQQKGNPKNTKKATTSIIPEQKDFSLWVFFLVVTWVPSVLSSRMINICLQKFFYCPSICFTYSTTWKHFIQQNLFSNWYQKSRRQ